MKIYGFYFIALINNWREVVKPQLTRIFNSSLMNDTDKLYVHVFYQDENDFYRVESLLTNLTSKVEITKSTFNNYEFPTLELVKEKSKTEEFYCWYIHTKGVSITENTKTFYHGSQDLSYLLDCVRDWREYMEYFIIDNSKNCLNHLDNGFDACGVQLSQAQNPKYYTFSGNFWWSKSSYIQKLPELTPEFKKNRWNAESWIGMGEGNLMNLHTNNAGYMEKITENYKI